MHTVVVNRNTSPFDVYIGRPSRWGNPYVTRESLAKGMKQTQSMKVELVVDTREEAVEQYRRHLGFRLYTSEMCPLGHPDKELKQELLSLQGKRLGCWCAPKPCHGDVLKEFSDALAAGKKLRMGPDGYYFD